MTRIKNLGFTLIELLVVIAVIAILVAITLPSLRSVQNTSRTLKCASNLKQIGAVMVLFATDHVNRFPESGGAVAWNSTDASTGQASWMQQLSPYAGLGAASTAADPRTTPGGSIFTCPASSTVYAADKYYSYFNGSHAAYAVKQSYSAVNRTLINHPAEQILSGDITDWGATAVNDADKNDNSVCPIDLQSTFHGGAINLLFADGHVQQVQWNSGLKTPGYFDPSRMCTIYSGTGQATYEGDAPGQ
jgi:prepilin-type N-terminal cleavage/methylation domain-containing protein/prepilin-type processing-associated H-X9-DG protein